MLDKMMKSLAEALKVGDFIASENGSYNIEVDQLSLTIKQHASWILWEATLPFQFKEHLDYQQEQALQRCMQLSLKTIREDGGVLTTNDDQQLILQSKVRVEDCSVERFSALLSKHVNLCERYIALLEQARVNHTINHTVWLP
ncbi:YscB family type III secretion system chaperone [Vibrio sp. B513a]|uniref:Tir chaperone protein n=3 Tax=Vibrio harveyi group TaxID=717610 RepID=A0A455LR62_VIBAL|nr:MULTISPECIES: YscB family type III secretion system chaperone [Vibrio]AGV16596.1 putative type III export apparatus protein NosA [Vibrio alginolyticus NBRC 15630 = ATCC 17749]AVF70459.1 YscB family type III secretion system chaperone [Vibrio alginolyticus]AYN25046.1 Tir chaperone protein [Vibrio alginolyticus]EGQ7649532.1 YscB family type III secretion system chaperone [Vibrio alginolyticus]EGQ8155100.1 YscB family type III secretion system chaperone [Vibrio alginolyticus]